MKRRWLARGTLLVAILAVCLFSTAADAYAAESSEVQTYTVTSIEEVVTAIRSSLVERKACVVTYLSDVHPDQFDNALVQEVYDSVLAHTGVGTEGDYLYQHMRTYSASVNYVGIDEQTGRYAYAFSYENVSAATTAQQEEQMDAKIHELFEEWQIYDKPDYYKVKIIYDYICSHATYDYEHYQENDYLLQHTAYAALIDGTAVCDGFASLFYRMANDAGVDTRIVRGMAGESHAWNLVCLDGIYYWLDSTWDVGVYTEEYEWLLKGQNEFYNHEPYDDWSNYSISETDYVRPLATSVEIKELPTQLEYTQGDPLKTDGLVLQLTYSDGQTVLVTDGWSTQGFDSGVIGTQTVSVYYDGVVATYDVTISAGSTGWVYHGTWGDLTWELTQEGLLTVSGEGAIKDNDFGHNTVPWRNYVDQVTSLVVENGVTKIGRYAFYNMYCLTSVTIADSVTKIDYKAFEACFDLAAVQLPDGLVDIGFFAFSQCESLTKIVIPDSVVSIPEYAFSDCIALTDIHIGPNVSFIGEGCFENTAYFNDQANREDGALYLGDCLLYVFANGETSAYEISEGTALIAGGAFASYRDLKSLILPTSVKYINTAAFRTCTELQQVYYDGSSADWREMQIGQENTALLLAEIILGNPEYDFTITTDETLVVQHLVGNGGAESSDANVAEIVSEYMEGKGFQYVLKPLRPGSVTVYVLDSSRNRESFYTVLIQEGNHKLEFVALLSPATCTQPGMEQYICIYCGHEETVETELAEHSWVYDAPVKVTCETDGLTYGFHCSVCQYEDPAQQVIPATGHDYGGWYSVHKPTATDPAEYRRDCANCDSFELREEFPTEVWITSWPDKRDYLEGEPFDPTGLEVMVCYDDGRLEDVTEYSISGYDPTPGIKTITIGCGGKTATFTVYVEAKSVERVEITTLPDKATYQEGESFDAAGMVVTAYYNNGTNAIVTDYTVSGYDSTPGTKTIVVSYGGKTATFEVTVNAKSLSSIDVTTKPGKLTYLEGESFDAAGMVVTAYYNNGTNAIVTGYTVSGYSSTPGTKTITVSYGGKSATFTVTVNAKPVETHDVYRIYGSNRFDTAFGAANMLKETLGVEKFDNVIVACGTNFADALAGSYLGKVKNAPILLVQPNMVPAVREYIEANLQPGGTVYLLGGETIVPGGVSEGLTQFTTKRLWGANRYETNLAILREAGVTGGEILVCTGYGFADSLSASAVGKPILLVDKKLTAGQEAYLAGLTNDSYVIVGGVGAVNETVEASLRGYGAIERLAGTNRFATSVMVAERFFDAPINAVVAYAANFPDGLCGGPLAMSMGGPLLLTANNDAAITAAYTEANGIRDGVVLGGPGLISDAAVRQIFAMEVDDSIVVK